MTTTHHNHHNHQNHHNQPQGGPPNEFIEIYFDMDPKMTKLMFSVVDAARDDAIAGRDKHYWESILELSIRMRDRIENAMAEHEVTMLGAFVAENWHFLVTLLADECCRILPQNWDIAEASLRRRYVAYALAKAVSDNLPYGAEEAMRFSDEALDLVRGTGDLKAA